MIAILSLAAAVVGVVVILLQKRWVIRWEWTVLPVPLPSTGSREEEPAVGYALVRTQTLPGSEDSVVGYPIPDAVITSLTIRLWGLSDFPLGSPEHSEPRNGFVVVLRGQSTGVAYVDSPISWQTSAEKDQLAVIFNHGTLDRFAQITLTIVSSGCPFIEVARLPDTPDLRVVAVKPGRSDEPPALTNLTLMCMGVLVGGTAAILNSIKSMPISGTWVAVVRGIYLFAIFILSMIGLSALLRAPLQPVNLFVYRRIGAMRSFLSSAWVAFRR